MVSRIAVGGGFGFSLILLILLTTELNLIR